MQRIDLNSALLQAVAYWEQEALLELEFRSGAIYHYYGVPAPIYGELLSAASKGKYFHRQIRTRFSYSKVGVRNHW